MGAIAFFGDKYGSSVRVVQAGPTSLEFCGGTHVDSLGQIGPITLLSEGSIGSNTRRIFALTGHASLNRALERERLVQSARRAAAHGARRAAGRHRPPGRAPARGRAGAGAAAPAVERGGGQGAGRGGRGRRRRGGGPPRRGGARRPADPGPGGPAPRRGARRRARRVARRARRWRSWPPPAGRPTPPSSCKTLGQMVGGGGGGSAEVALAGGKDPSRYRGGAGRGAAASVRVSGGGAAGGPGRVAALDLGARRIGVAYSDSGRSLASPWGTIERSGDPARDRRPWSRPSARSRRRRSWSGSR